MILVIYACMAASPAVCMQERLTYTNTGALACLYQQQFDVARWSGNNPEWKVKRASCEDPQRVVAYGK